MTTEKNVSVRTAVIAMALIIAVGAVPRFAKLGHPFDGYHAMNEAWYATTARNFAHGSSFFSPKVTERIIDYKVRPVYTYLSCAAIRLLGDRESSVRAVSALFSLLSLIWVYLIAKRLLNRRAGLLAAAFLAVEPAYVMLGRQAQPDATYVSFMLAAALVYLISRNHRREAELKLAAGLMWGLSIFTKNFGVMLLPCVVIGELLDTRSPRFLNRRFLLFLLPAILIPAPFILFHAMTNPGSIAEVYRHSAFRLPGPLILAYMGREIIWAVSPLICGLGVFGLARETLRGGRAARWLWALLLPFAALYYILHVHSYYLLGMVPFLTLAAAAPFGDPRIFRRWAPALLLIIILTAFQTTITLTATKLWHTRFVHLSEDVNKNGMPALVVLSDEVFANYRPVFYYYMPDADSISIRYVKRNDKGKALLMPRSRVYMVDFLSEPILEAGPYRKVYGQYVYGLTVAGRAIMWRPFTRHSFIPERIEILKAPGAGKWGFQPIIYAPSLLVTELPPGYSMQYENGWWKFQPAEQR